ncbi:hypothetical protein Hanom_Chr01g00057931 [Helianthus anomalus]
MSLNWRMNRDDKPMYLEDGKAFKREGGKMATVPKRVDEELWYLRIVKNFVLPRDEELAAQPPLALALKRKNVRQLPLLRQERMMRRRLNLPNQKNVRGEKKGIRHSFDSWCDYVVVSDSLEGITPTVVRKPKAEPLDTSDIPPSNPDDPIDLESTPEHLLRKKAGKRKQTNAEAKGQPA